MLNNINSTTVGLNQNLGKLQELGNVKNDAGEPLKTGSCAVWVINEGETPKGKDGDVLIERRNDGTSRYYKAYKDDDGQVRYYEMTRDNFISKMPSAMEKDRGDIRRL